MNKINALTLADLTSSRLDGEIGSQKPDFTYGVEDGEGR